MAVRLDTGNAATATSRPSAVSVRPTASLIDVTKAFGGTIAIRDVSLDLHPGEVLALLGENGAGKSTCVKLLAGVYRPDAGQVVFDGEPVDLHSPLDAQARGIAVMHQHPGLFGDLSVAENIFIGHVLTSRAGLLDRESMRREARRLLETVGLLTDPDEPLNRLRSSEQQLVEIARALSVKARVLIMDEPTAALSRHEVDRLFAVVDGLRSRGVAMMFVSHRMEEIYRVADRVSVLRDGRLIATEPAGALAPERAIQLMVGRALGDMYPKLADVPGPAVLEIQGLSRAGAFADVSFTLRAGEIVGFAGLVGSGRTEVARVLFGVDRRSGGSVRLDGREMTFRSPADAVKAGVAYVSEDRIGQSLIMDFDILTNASLPFIDRATRAGLVRRRLELGLVQPFLERLRLRFRSYDQVVKTLSGGNQQKVVLSKWLATHPRVLILDEPTQGVDVQTKAEVHAVIAALAEQGMAILLISSELPELIGMSHRIVVFREGRIAAEIARAEASQERILTAATDAVVGNRQADADSSTPGPKGQRKQTAPGASVRSRLLPARIVHRIAATREIGLVLAIVAVVIPVFAINPRMLGTANLTALAMDAALLTIVASGQMLVLITRNIDLSVASVIGLAAYLSADLLRDVPGAGVAAAIALACAVGLACGLVNGLVVTLGRVPAIVVTLGTLSLYRGIDSLLAGGRQVSADQVPQDWLDLTGSRLFGIPAVVLIALAVLLLLGFVLRALPLGRELYAIGSNPDGAALIGIRIRRRVLGAFAAAGLLAGFDGALWASRYATIDARVALGYELSVIAAVVVGGVAIRGGSGSVLGVALGAVALLVIRNGLTLVRVDPLWLQGVYGLVILVAIGIDAFVVRRSQAARGRLR
jgi:ribose transport system ATP-binding protein/rhamnose transport system ATP-binding protein